MASADNDPDSHTKLQQLEEKLNDLTTRIKQTIGDATCEEQSQCRAQAVGHRPCGGPSEYLAYSTLNTDRKALKNLAQQHTLTHLQINRLKNIMSTCEMILQPPVSCTNGKCIIEK